MKTDPIHFAARLSPSQIKARLAALEVKRQTIKAEQDEQRRIKLLQEVLEQETRLLAMSGS